MKKFKKEMKKINKYIGESNSTFKKTAKKLFRLMLKKAMADSEYREKLELWLTHKKSTVFLRDELVHNFKEHEIFLNLDDWNPFGNSWMILDSANVLRTREELEEIGLYILTKDTQIQLNNGKILYFSHFSSMDNPIFTLDDSERKFTILDDIIYTASGMDEPDCPVTEAYQTDYFKNFTFDFFKGCFLKKH